MLQLACGNLLLVREFARSMGITRFVGIYWHPLHATSAGTILLAAAIGCFANWLKNRTFHCGITAWLFLASAIVFFLSSIDLIQIDPRFVCPFLAIGVAVSFILEWRYAGRPGRQQHP